MHLPVTLHMNGRKVETIALVDSGATGIFIDQVFAKEHHLQICNLWKEIAVMNVDGTKNQDSSIRKYVTANLEVKGRQKKYTIFGDCFGNAEGYSGIALAHRCYVTSLFSMRASIK